MNEAQERYGNAILNYPLVFGLGAAGTGKTYVCGALAAQALHDKDIDKIIITRPAVEAGEQLGFLPGDKDEKYEPWLQPFRDVLHERLGKSETDYNVKHGKIEGAPLAYMRGRTFKNAFVIMDEAQNATPAQMRMFLTRIGENCTVIVNGDLAQSDLPGASGLAEAIRIVGFIPSVKIFEFHSSDSVRSGLCREICECYEQELL
jgi:phosphate starvation-inducible PhoH-like protein